MRLALYVSLATAMSTAAWAGTPHTCPDGFNDDCTASGAAASDICIVTGSGGNTVYCDLSTSGAGVDANVFAVKDGSSWDIFGRDNGGNDFCCTITPTGGSSHIFRMDTGFGTTSDTMDLQYTPSGGSLLEMSDLGVNLSVQIDGDDGNDAILGSGETSNTYSEALYGGAGDDTLTGREGNDDLHGEAGSDKLYGNEGEDDLFCGNGADTTVFGGPGDDFIQGGMGNDILDGDGGDDLIEGGDGVDRLNGDAGYDTLRGGDGDDTLNGGTEDDVLCGDLEGSDDDLDGGSGDDTLWGGGTMPADLFDGGAGTDECGEDGLKGPFPNCETLITTRPSECPV